MKIKVGKNSNSELFLIGAISRFFGKVFYKGFFAVHFENTERGVY